MRNTAEKPIGPARRPSVDMMFRCIAGGKPEDVLRSCSAILDHIDEAERNHNPRLAEVLREVSRTADAMACLRFGRTWWEPRSPARARDSINGL